MEADQYAKVLQPFDGMELLGLVIFFIGLGLVFAAVSETGFFAYLFINRFGAGLFRSFWPTVQILLIAFVLFDLVYFPYISNKNSSLWVHILIAAVILVYGIIIAKIKANETNKHAFIPALFLMVVMTVLEWVPGLRTSGASSNDYKWLMIIPLLVCNTYQLLILHRLNKKGQLEAEARRKAKATDQTKAGKS
ncbi:KinB-signaling pathway activation protein [Virgibacillus sp. 179-BFC.A HS]|uniref:KinB-signaling pathway activation protein n=1 Tax=Tigheibacillus jepli TaxID=3035914 RepID=A0ABU5CLJ6_9BACI|nr:KinB-signaling pathway activation protein [Virgibacillus sp. 179-BFC.A HS]MDY0407238.1 KinB-signaling pathway activation protein [Virgibacillus sp. 179-BFC.A HS]